MDPNSTASSATSEAIQTIKPALLSIIDEMHSFYSAGKDFAREQAPILAKEMVNLEIVKASIWLALGLLIVSGGFWILRQMKKWVAEAKTYSDRDDCEKWFLTMIACFVVGGLFVMSNAIDLFSVIFAPRLFIIKEAASLLKSIQ